MFNDELKVKKFIDLIVLDNFKMVFMCNFFCMCKKVCWNIDIYWGKKLYYYL